MVDEWAAEERCARALTRARPYLSWRRCEPTRATVCIWEKIEPSKLKKEVVRIARTTTASDESGSSMVERSAAGYTIS